MVAGIMNLIGSHDVTIQVGDHAQERDDDGRGGNLYATRCWSQAYSNSLAVGTVAAVLGGAMTWTGGSIVSIYGMQNQFGAGHTLFTGKNHKTTHPWPIPWLALTLVNDQNSIDTQATR